MEVLRVRFTIDLEDRAAEHGLGRAAKSSGLKRHELETAPAPALRPDRLYAPHLLLALVGAPFGLRFCWRLDP